MKTLFGGILLAVGILIMAATGLCTGFFFLNVLGSSGGSEIVGLVGLALVVGGIPFLLGLGLFMWGRALLRVADREREQ